MLAWGGMPADQATAERYREMAAVGFTHTVCYAPEIDTVVRLLDDGHAANLKQLVAAPAMETDPESVVARVKNHPGVFGYYLRDEPSAQAFGKWGDLCRRINAADPTRPCYVNLLPTHAGPDQMGTADYADYLRRFIAQIPTPLLSYDHYPVVRPDGNPAHDASRPDFYANLELASAAARHAGRPLWTFVLTASHAAYPDPTLAHLRYQGYSNLAYGSVVLQYFTYWTLLTDSPWGQALINRHGNRSPTYDLVKSFMAEIQSVRGAFVGSRVISVGHTGETRPTGTNPYEPAAPIAAVTFSGQGGVVSHLAKGDERFLIVVNRDLHATQKVAIRLDGSHTDGSRAVAVADKAGKLVPVAGQEWTADLTPGDAAILSWTVAPASP